MLPLWHGVILTTTSTSSQGFLDRLAHLILNLLSLLPEKGLTLLSALALMILARLSNLELPLELSDAKLRSLKLLFKQDDLLLMTALHFLYSFFVLLGDFGKLPVQLSAEKLLKLFFLICHCLFVLFQICLVFNFDSIDLRCTLLRLMAHVVNNFV